MKRTERGEAKANPEMYRIWLGMIHRCENPKNTQFKNYGARGIAVCERWKVFRNFLDDVSPRLSPKHSLDRKNNDLGYSKQNCRWATAKQQAQNQRRTVFVKIGGRRTPIIEVARSSGIPVFMIEHRMRKGMTVEQAIAMPKMKSGEAHRVYRAFEFAREAELREQKAQRKSLTRKKSGTTP